MKRILIVCNSLEFLVSHRFEFVKNISTISETSILGGGHQSAQNKLGVLNVNISLSESASNRLSVVAAMFFFLQIKRNIKRSDADIIIPIGIKSCFFCSLFGFRAFGSKCIVPIFPGLGRIFSSNRFFIIRLASKFLFTLAMGNRNIYPIFQTFADYQSLFFFKARSRNKPLFVRGSGVNLKHYRNPSRLDIDDLRPIRVGFIGRLIEEKGILDFLALSQMMHESQNPSFEFIYAGGFGLNSSKRVISRVNEAECQGYAKWLGFVEKPENFFSTIDILVYPARYGDGIPKVLLEACAAGCYAIAYRSPGVEVAIAQYRTGFILDEFTQEALEREIKSFARLTKNERIRIALNCAKRAEALFSETAVVSKLIRYIRKIDQVRRESC